MENTISMQDMRHLNLFTNITKINTRFCFKYNNIIFFCVPRRLVSKAIGENGKNSKQLSKILNKKIKIIPYPNGIQDAKTFVQSIVSPATIRDVESKDDKLTIYAGPRNKATLIGREKKRLLEMKKIIKNFFRKEIRIV